MTAPARKLPVGRIDYLNTLPIYHPLDAGWVGHDFDFVRGVPADLNRRMMAGELALSSASSLEYATRPDRYLLLPDLAIGSRGPVMSVLLLSRQPLNKLDAATILISSQTHTSAALLRVLLSERLKARPRFVSGRPGPALDAGQRPEAFLAIGDEALRLASHPDYPYVWDLGEAWREWTGLPFIFGVWIADREAMANAPRRLATACFTLVRAKNEGTARLEEICRLAAMQSPFGGMEDLERARTYFQGLSYDLGQEEQCGLRLFLRHLAKAGITPAAPELRFVDQKAMDRAMDMAMDKAMNRIMTQAARLRSGT